MSTDDSGPAFTTQYTDGDGQILTVEGLSKRQYAAIHLRVPDSGLPWLDEMIREARVRDGGAEADDLQEFFSSAILPAQTVGQFTMKTGEPKQGEFVPEQPDYYDGEWHAWGGGECPVHVSTEVEAKLRTGVPLPISPADDLYWEHHNERADIIRFRVVKP